MVAQSESFTKNGRSGRISKERDDMTDQNDEERRRNAAKKPPPISLDPLSTEDAIKGLWQVDPAAVKRKEAREKARRAEKAKRR
jgi:hypothetical protein